jgi:hypothetical protein
MLSLGPDGARRAVKLRAATAKETDLLTIFELGTRHVGSRRFCLPHGLHVVDHEVYVQTSAMRKRRTTLLCVMTFGGSLITSVGPAPTCETLLAPSTVCASGFPALQKLPSDQRDGQ